MAERAANKGGENPVRQIRAQEVSFDCSQLPCVHFEIQWTNPLPPPTFANWRAVDENGQPVNLNPAEMQQVSGTITNPGPFQPQPPRNGSMMKCISPCVCTDEQTLPWVQGPHTIPVDVTMDVMFAGSAASKVTVSVNWKADRFRWTVGRCADMA